MGVRQAGRATLPLDPVRLRSGLSGGQARDITPHTLRHTFASRLAITGVDLRTIHELGCWKQLKMVERYAH
jgi:site-specific recombinase XerD